MKNEKINNDMPTRRELVLTQAFNIAVLFFGTNLIFQFTLALDPMATGAVVILILANASYWGMLGWSGLTKYDDDFKAFKELPMLEKICMAITGTWFIFKINSTCFNFLIGYTYLYNYTAWYWVMRVLKWIMYLLILMADAKCVYDSYIKELVNTPKTEKETEDDFIDFDEDDEM